MYDEEYFLFILYLDGASFLETLKSAAGALKEAKVRDGFCLTVLYLKIHSMRIFRKAGTMGSNV